MVENTVKQKKDNPIWKNTLLQIAIGTIVALGISVYWQFNGLKNNFSGGFQLPDISEDMVNPLSLLQPPTGENGDRYKHFSTSDGYLKFDYPAAYEGGKDTVTKIIGSETQLSNSLLIAYKTTYTEVAPSSLTVTTYNATTTDEVVGQIKQAFKLQQCPMEIKKTDKEGNSDYDLFESTYKCGDQGDLSYWQARTAIIENINGGFYAVTVATISKNWEKAEFEIKAIIDSISINKPADTNAESEPAGDKDNLQNNETNN